MTRENLRRAELPAYIEQQFGLKLSKSYLAKLASVGGGPRFRRIGRAAVYRVEDVDNWIANRSSPIGASATEIRYSS